MTDVGEPTRGTAMSYHSYMIPHRDHGRQLRGGGDPPGEPPCRAIITKSPSGLRLTVRGNPSREPPCHIAPSDPLSGSRPTGVGKPSRAPPRRVVSTRFPSGITTGNSGGHSSREPPRHVVQHDKCGGSQQVNRHVVLIKKKNPVTGSRPTIVGETIMGTAQSCRFSLTLRGSRPTDVGGTHQGNRPIVSCLYIRSRNGITTDMRGKPSREPPRRIVLVRSPSGTTTDRCGGTRQGNRRAAS